jgi:hypothetical protein
MPSRSSSGLSPEFIRVTREAAHLDAPSVHSAQLALFAAVSLPGSRPVISSAPTAVSYGSTFAVGTPDAGSISKVSLVRLSSVTHPFDQNQRFMGLTFLVQAGGLSVAAPASGNLAPPGDYLLFLVNADGVPSIGRFVNIR